MKSSKFILSTLIAAAAMTSTAWAEEYVTTQSNETLYLNSTYTDAYGSVTDDKGYLIGYNAFDSYFDAISDGLIVGTTKTLHINGKVMSGSGIADLNFGTLTFTGVNDATVDFDDNSFRPNSGSRVTVDSSVTLNNIDQLMALDNGTQIVLNGEVNANQIWVSCSYNGGANITINAGADVNINDQLSIRGGTMNVIGNVVDRKTTNEEASLTWGWGQIGYSGWWTSDTNNLLNITNAVVSGSGNLQIGNANNAQGELRATNSVVSVSSISMPGLQYNGTNYGQWVTLNNSTLKVTSKFDIGMNGCVVAAGSDITADTITTVASDNGKANIELNGGSLTANSITNNGMISVSKTSTLDIDTLTGNAIQVNDGATLANSNVGGYVYIMKNATFTGDNTIKGVNLYGESNANLTVADDASLTVTDLVVRDDSTLNVYGTVSGSGISSGGTVNVNGGSISGYLQNYHPTVKAQFNITNKGSVTLTNAYKDVSVLMDVLSSMTLSGTAYKAVNVAIKDYTGADVTKKLVDVVQDSVDIVFAITNGDGLNSVVLNNDLYVTTQDQEVLHVKSDYSEVGQTTTEGYLIGYNAGHSLADVVQTALATGNSTITTEVILEDEVYASAGNNTSARVDLSALTGKTLTISGNMGANESLFAELNDDKDETAVDVQLDLEAGKFAVSKLKADNNATIQINNATLNGVYNDAVGGGTALLYAKNSGVITVDHSTLNSMRLSLASGGTMNITDSSLSYNGGQSITVDGTGSTLTITGSDIDVDAFSVVNGGKMVLSGSTLDESNGGEGSFSVGAGSTLEIINSSFTASSTLTNAGAIKVTNSTLSAGTIENGDGGTITFSGKSTLESGVLTGVVTIAKGATLTVASSSLLADERLILENNGTIVCKKIEEGAPITIGGGSVSLPGGDSFVTLTAAAGTTVTFSEVAILEDVVDITVEIDGVAKNVEVLAAWSFGVVPDELGDVEYDVTVEMDVGEGLSADELRILHKKGDNGWKDVTADIDGITYKDGKVSFNAKSFSSYAVANVPEPSAFGLLAGLGALALVAARRRRRK